MWTYEQGTGELFDAHGERVAIGYSGSGHGKNAPAWQAHHDVGPIPCGRYTIGPPEHVRTSGPHGPYVLRLTPDAANEMFGRSGFLMHGDSVKVPGSASHGCIIQARTVRERVGASGDDRLDVVNTAPIATTTKETT